MGLYRRCGVSSLLYGKAIRTHTLLPGSLTLRGRVGPGCKCRALRSAEKSETNRYQTFQRTFFCSTSFSFFLLSFFDYFEHISIPADKAREISLLFSFWLLLRLTIKYL